MTRLAATGSLSRQTLCCLMTLLLGAQSGVLCAASDRDRVRSYAMPREVKDPAPAALVPAPAAMVAQATDADEDLPLGRDELFGTIGDDPSPASGSGDTPTAAPGDIPTPAPGARQLLAIRGFVDFAPAYAYESPGHWARGVVRTQLETRASLGASAKWKASVRLDVDPVYYATDFYPDEVKKDQRLDLQVRETYLDLTLPRNWELRLGRQHVVWGEAVALFFADVVSARDLRDYILPEFEILRIPQWAARAEYFGERMHLELLWVPFPTYDDIGEPGAEFYPYHPGEVAGFDTVLRGDQRPANTLSNTSYGARMSGLISGWDLSAFFYRSHSVSSTLYRELVTTPVPTIVYQPRHDRIWQLGGTLAKDFGSVVLKSEAVYTHGRHYEVSDLASSTGTVKQNTLDYLLGLDFILPMDGRLNVQGFQRIYFDHDDDILFDQFETGFSVLVSGKVRPKLEPQLLYIQSLNSNDRLLRPRINWYARPDLRISVGVDIFAGPNTGAFGTFGDSDRVYAELRYTF
ncbi:MAG: hypothetical protein IT532_06975 [Burkholderiales bacterium]|nr:hypothetical protein [Burkholderiales bacterium]